MVRKGLIIATALLASTAIARAQIVYGAGGTGSGGGGTVTSVTPGAGLTSTPNPIVGAGTISTTYVIRANTATTDTIVSGDAAKLVTESNASAVAVTLPQAMGSFAAGFAFAIQNKGAGTVTITPNTSTINGNPTLALTTGQGCTVVSDGTNWQISNCGSLSAGGTIVGTTGNGLYFSGTNTPADAGTATNVKFGSILTALAGAPSGSTMLHVTANSVDRFTVSDFGATNLNNLGSCVTILCVNGDYASNGNIINTGLTKSGSYQVINTLISSTAPTVGSGFGTTPSISANNGTAAFEITVGTGGTSQTGVITMPTATTGWNCQFTDITTTSTTVAVTKQTASTPTSVSVASFTNLYVASAWAASDKIRAMCAAY